MVGSGSPHAANRLREVFRGDRLRFLKPSGGPDCIFLETGKICRIVTGTAPQATPQPAEWTDGISGTGVRHLLEVGLDNEDGDGGQSKDQRP